MNHIYFARPPSKRWKGKIRIEYRDMLQTNMDESWLVLDRSVGCVFHRNHKACFPLSMKQTLNMAIILIFTYGIIPLAGFDPQKGRNLEESNTRPESFASRNMNNVLSHTPFVIFSHCERLKKEQKGLRLCNKPLCNLVEGNASFKDFGFFGVSLMAWIILTRHVQAGYADSFQKACWLSELSDWPCLIFLVISPAQLLQHRIEFCRKALFDCMKRTPKGLFSSLYSVFCFFISILCPRILATSSGVFPTFLLSVFSLPNSVSSATNR